MNDTGLNTIVLMLTGLSLIGGMGFAAWKVIASISAIQSDVAELKRDGYTCAAASEHALRMKIHNPDLCVPDPRNPDRLIGREGI